MYLSRVLQLRYFKKLTFSKHVVDGKFQCAENNFAISIMTSTTILESGSTEFSNVTTVLPIVSTSVTASSTTALVAVAGGSTDDSNSGVTIGIVTAAIVLFCIASVVTYVVMLRRIKRQSRGIHLHDEKCDVDLDEYFGETDEVVLERRNNVQFTNNSRTNFDQRGNGRRKQVLRKNEPNAPSLL